MTDGGLLLAIPAQSVLIRLLLVSIAAVLAARLLLRTGLRVPRVRVLAALLPAVAILAILVISFGQYRIPSLMVSGGSSGQVVLPIKDTYAFLGPSALPFIVGLWALATAGFVARRMARVTRLSRRTHRASQGELVPSRVRRTIERVSIDMQIEPPAVAMARLDGGACVVGIRRPVLVLDPALVDRLDNRELEGVVAHEMAHIRRHDNLVALMMSVVQDAVFFIPGGRWALRQLLVEREIAADQLAVEVTRRPAALAGGLLKVIEEATPNAACAALLPRATLVRRVEHLVDERPPPSRKRSLVELSRVVAATSLVITSAVGVPRLIAGADADGGVGVLLTTPVDGNASTATATTGVPVVFDAYRESTMRMSLDDATGLVLDDRPSEMSAAVLRACDAAARRCSTPAAMPTMALRPRPQFEVDAELETRWHAREMMEAGELLRIYWLASLN